MADVLAGNTINHQDKPDGQYLLSFFGALQGTTLKLLDKKYPRRGNLRGEFYIAISARDSTIQKQRALLQHILCGLHGTEHVGKVGLNFPI
jgi:hypothetical protein